MKKCNTCELDSPLSEFRFRYGKHESQCKKCRSIHRKQHRINNAEHERATGRAYSNTTEGRAIRTLGNMQSRSRKEGWPTPEFTVEEIVEATEGKCCSRTGIPFFYPAPYTRTNPFAPSADRIDISIGYTKANVQWVCWMYNIMKSDFSPEALSKFIDSLQSSTNPY